MRRFWLYKMIIRKNHRFYNTLFFSYDLIAVIVYKNVIVKIAAVVGIGLVIQINSVYRYSRLGLEPVNYRAFSVCLPIYRSLFSGVVVAKLDPYSGREMRRLVDLVHLELVALAEQDVLVKIFPYKRAGRQIFKAVKKRIFNQISHVYHSDRYHEQTRDNRSSALHLFSFLSHRRILCGTVIILKVKGVVL